ncbi:hypothetical protein DPMN_130545 [Dreissena polymorpha]|uniref:Uncharacterized protein n=1 Tax=Dreissena polymorpha TaxID=45954 RepID=A0A9D4H335_DREPO|nr:hypothetical protein DPMN_130545 [Dreissena polymorpha]
MLTNQVRGLFRPPCAPATVVGKLCLCQPSHFVVSGGVSDVASDELESLGFPQHVQVFRVPLKDGLRETRHEDWVQDVRVCRVAEREAPHEVPDVQPHDHVRPGIEQLAQQGVPTAVSVHIHDLWRRLPSPVVPVDQSGIMGPSPIPSAQVMTHMRTWPFSLPMLVAHVAVPLV